MYALAPGVTRENMVRPVLQRRPPAQWLRACVLKFCCCSSQKSIYFFLINVWGGFDSYYHDVRTVVELLSVYSSTIHSDDIERVEIQGTKSWSSMCLFPFLHYSPLNVINYSLRIHLHHYQLFSVIFDYVRLGIGQAPAVSSICYVIVYVWVQASHWVGSIFAGFYFVHF